MQVSQQQLDSDIQKFLNSDAADEFFKEHITPAWLLAAIAVFCLGCGALLLLTLIGIWLGIKLILFGLRSSRSKGEPGQKFLNRRDEIRGFIGHVIITGPEITSAGERAALILGTFEDVSHDELARLAEFLGEVYSEENDDPRHDELRELLQDDTYNQDRRRVVPKAYRNGHRLYLFDMRIKLNETRPTGHSGALGVIALPGKDGAALQLPWKVVNRAVTFDA